MQLRQDMKIFLVGFMGAGKSTLGRHLAGRLGWEFGDIDREMEKAEGSSIRRIFAEKGEPYFRALERRILERVVAEPSRAVIACGGGTFCNQENQALLHGAGITVWVDQPFDQIWGRRGNLAGERPLLRGEREVRDLYERRLVWYRTAMLRLPVVEGGLSEATEALARLLRDEHGIG